MHHRLSRKTKVALLSFVLLFQLPSFLFAIGEAGTYFQVFVPPNNQNWNRHAALMVTAIDANTTFQIIDDGMDGDTDDSVNGTLTAGQTYLLYIKDNGVNDDSGGGSAKQDGDYFIVISSKPVIVGMATKSENQYDWLPATNGTSKGTKFLFYNLPTNNKSSKRDLNVFVYTNNTTVTVREISTTSLDNTGYTSVQANRGKVVFQEDLDIGEDIIFEKSEGKNCLSDGETYLIESNHPITVLYGSLYKNERDAAGYVPSSNGSGTGDLFYFTVHAQSNRKQEVRVTSWDDNNTVNLQYFKNGSWINVQTWTLQTFQHSDWVSSSGNIERVFRVTCSSGKSVSVFAGNEIETGNGSSSDFATMVSSNNGSTAGTTFLAYMGSPGQQNQVTDPFTGSKIGRATHLYLFAADTATVHVTDLTTNGGLINRTYTILPGRYADCYLNLAEWQSIYNGNGNPNSGPDRPYLKVVANRPIAVLNTNFSDDWMTYFGPSSRQNFAMTSQVFDESGQINPCFDILDTATVLASIYFLNATTPLQNANLTVSVPDEAVVIGATFVDDVTQATYNAVLTTDSSTGITTLTFPTLTSLSQLHTFSFKMKVILAVNHFDGSLITDHTLINITTSLSGDYNGTPEQSNQTSGILICNNISLQDNIVTPQANTWAVAWGDFNDDCYPDLCITNYDADQPNMLYENNGDGTFSEVTLPIFQQDKAPSTTATWGDYDNDGDLDLFIANNVGTGNFLYRNEGINGAVRIYNDPIVNDLGYAHGSAWVDYDNDGWLDMFTAEYFPSRFNNLYHNNGDGTFSKITTAAPVLHAGSSVVGVWGDYDNDGDPDLFVANTNFEKNFLYKNEGNGNFTRIMQGAITNDLGSSVGASWGDYDNDGDLDIFVANSGNQNNFLYRNDGNDNFTRITQGDIVNDGGHSHGSAWGDVNNDGWLDLFVANDQNGINFLYLNNGDGTFTKVDYRLSPFSTGGGNSFGAAFADFDNDGFLDLFVANHSNQENVLMPNYYTNHPNTNFMTFKLIGTNSNTSAIGVRIGAKATINGVARWQYREISGLSGGGIGGQNDLRPHFGFGDATAIDSVVIWWTSGYKQVLTNISTNQTCYTIQEKAGSEVRGTVFFDANKNCIKDANEIGIPNTRLVIQPINKQVTTDENGDYTATLGIGQYTIQQFAGANWSQNCPALNGVATINVQQIGGVYPNIDFADTAACQYPDLQVSLSTTALRVGFESVYAITYRNLGTQKATNVALQVDFGSHIQPILANLNWNSVSGNVYTWNISEIGIGEVFTILVADSIKTTALIGDDLKVVAIISHNSNDCNTADNLAVDINEAVGAIDPNDITNYPDGYIRYDQEITYRIRFQNVGNDLVNRVIVRDELPEWLDLATLVRGATSHPYQFRIQGTRTLVWDFENINLLDSTTNEPESHGFIWFKIKPIRGIQSGTTIENHAEIYFDNSAVVITNIATNTINGNPQLGDLTVWPNPNNIGELNFKLEQIAFDSEEVIESVQIFDMRGISLLQETGFNEAQIQISLPPNLPSGYYVVLARTDKGHLYRTRLMIF